MRALVRSIFEVSSRLRSWVHLEKLVPGSNRASGLIRPFKGLVRLFKSLIRPLKVLIRPLKGLITHVKGLIRPF